MSWRSRKPRLDPAVYDDGKDDLEEFIAERARENPKFPAMVEAALQRRIQERTNKQAKSVKSR